MFLNDPPSVMSLVEIPEANVPSVALTVTSQDWLSLFTEPDSTESLGAAASTATRATSLSGPMVTA